MISAWNLKGLEQKTAELLSELLKKRSAAGFADPFLGIASRPFG